VGISFMIVVQIQAAPGSEPAVQPEEELMDNAGDSQLQ
jgi:hypothetical protein